MLLDLCRKNEGNSFSTKIWVAGCYTDTLLKIDSETLAKREFTPTILFLFGLRIIHSVGREWCSLARDSEPISCLKHQDRGVCIH